MRSKKYRDGSVVFLEHRKVWVGYAEGRIVCTKNSAEKVIDFLKSRFGVDGQIASNDFTFRHQPKEEKMTSNSIIPFTYCAARFLEQWLKKERELHTRIAGPTNGPQAKELRKMLSHFSIQRNFTGLGNDELALTIIRLLVEVSSQVSNDPVSAVNDLASGFEAEFGQRNLSAASKLLWIRKRHPFVILDKQATSALTALGYDFDPGHYGEFYKAWHDAFSKRREEIRAASHRLVGPCKAFTAAHLLSSDADLLALVSEDWFQARVFDIYLWEIGSA